MKLPLKVELFPNGTCAVFDAEGSRVTVALNWVQDAEQIVNAVNASARPEARLKAEQVEWVVNDIAELGVKIGNQFFWLYKGHSLVYGDNHDTNKDGIVINTDDGKPMSWRPVFKREFGDCCHPVNYEDLKKCGHQHYIGTVSLSDSDEWKPLPAPDKASPQSGGKPE